MSSSQHAASFPLFCNSPGCPSLTDSDVKRKLDVMVDDGIGMEVVVGIATAWPVDVRISAKSVAAANANDEQRFIGKVVPTRLQRFLTCRKCRRRRV